MIPGYLLDTNVASVSAPGKTGLDVAVMHWLEELLPQSRIYVSVVSLAEIERGICLLEREGTTRRSLLLRQWLEEFATAFADRMISVDPVAARLIGQIDASARLKGFEPELADVIIAAAAKRHDLTVLTRNIRHFEPLGVPCIDPYAAARL